MKVNEEIPLIIKFELGSTKKTIRELLNITKGTTYRLENSIKNKVTIKVENTKIGYGTIYTKNGKMFVKITELGREEQ